MTGLRFFLLLFFPLLATSVNAEWHQRDDVIMGTTISIELWHDNKAQAMRLIDDCLAELHTIDRQMSTHLASSELSRVNRLAHQQAVLLSDNLFSVIKTALAVSAMSSGAFDITYASVGYLYHYRARKKPEPYEIDQHLPAIDYRSVVLNLDNKSIRFQHKNTRIDLGGIAKGYAMDHIAMLLTSQGLSEAVISAGGDTIILGSKRGEPWLIGIKDPRDTKKSRLVLPLSNIAISTSGDYERFFDVEGARYHHILDPKTGYSPNTVIRSVSVMGPEAMLTDALSTAVFVLGIKQGLQLINQLDGIDAIVISEDNKLYMSQGLKQL